MDVIKLSRPSGLTLYAFERPQLPFEPQGSDFVFRLLDLVATASTTSSSTCPISKRLAQFRAFDERRDLHRLRAQRRFAAARQAALHKIRELRGNAVSITLVANKKA